MDASEWDARYRLARESDGGRLWSAQAPQLVRETVSAFAPGRALDLATGDGRTAVWLARHGWTVTAVDFSAEAIDLARSHGGDAPVHWIVADATRWRPEGLFELVTVLYLHLPETDLRQVLTDAAGWLAPGGHLVVLGHDRDNITVGGPGPANPAILYTPQLLAGVVPAARIVRCETVRRELATDPELAGEGLGSGPRIALDTILVATS